MSPELCVEPDLESLYRKAAVRFSRLVRQAVEQKGVFSVALAGGSTPRGLYALLADDPELRAALPWTQMHFFWGDERHVPPDHPDSNYRMVWDVLLSKVPVPPENVHRIRAEGPNADAAARDYERVLREFFGLSGSEFPRLDLAFLGLGTDGHTASLFPGTPALEGRRRLVVANRVERVASYRITLTVPVFNNASCVAFLVAGKGKAQVLRDVLHGSHDPRRLPAQLITPIQGRLVWMVDAEAAQQLEADRGG
jgi:6-phosphogluconolactonase